MAGTVRPRWKPLSWPQDFLPCHLQPCRRREAVRRTSSLYVHPAPRREAAPSAGALNGGCIFHSLGLTISGMVTKVKFFERKALTLQARSEWSQQNRARKQEQEGTAGRDGRPRAGADTGVGEA